MVARLFGSRARAAQVMAVPFCITLAACGSTDALPTGSSATGAGGGGGDTSGGLGGQGGDGGQGGQGGQGAPEDKAAACTDTFGTALTAAFGRLDGTVLAVLRPTDSQCPRPNGDHVVVEVVMNGEAYRVVVNVQSSSGDPKVQFLELPHALPEPAWADGWHTGVTLDYVTDFGVHSDAFVPYGINELSDKVADAITIGQKISAYTESSGGDSAHKVHRNDGQIDGALVLDPDSAASRALLFHFADQTF